MSVMYGSTAHSSGSVGVCGRMPLGAGDVVDTSSDCLVCIVLHMAEVRLQLIVR